MTMDTPLPNPGLRAGILILLLGLLSADGWALELTRGPYLQRGTSDSIIIRWRTDLPSESVVRYGGSPAGLTHTTNSRALTTEHEVLVTGLAADTRYFYAVGSSGRVLAGGDSDHFFTTSPPAGAPAGTRIWVLGDSGTADDDAQAVRDAYLGYPGHGDTDLVLMLGDNAYSSGQDAEYQEAVFDIYPTVLRSRVLWPAMGNHDGYGSESRTQTGPYFDIFSLPRRGQAGGVPSGTEAYYAFDYANIHFICLDSYGSSRSPSGPMLTWLRRDLAATSRQWIIVYWHHPPYTMGRYNSDTGKRMTEMRRNVLPILDEYSVDLVLNGHSHAYERSFLLDGHYGPSATLTEGMILDGGDGREDGDGPYTKISGAPHQGVVYVVAGSAGETIDGMRHHPVMYSSLAELGSLILDIDGNRLDATFLQADGSVGDHFTIIKNTGKALAHSAN